MPLMPLTVGNLAAENRLDLRVYFARMSKPVVVLACEQPFRVHPCTGNRLCEKSAEIDHVKLKSMYLIQDRYLYLIDP